MGQELGCNILCKQKLLGYLQQVSLNCKLCFKQAENLATDRYHLLLGAVILPWMQKTAVGCFPDVFFGVHGHTVTFFQ